MTLLPKRLLALVSVLLAVCLVYSNSLRNSFHFDDFHTVTDNPAVRSLGNLPRIFTDTSAFSVLPANQTYRPLVTASLALDYALGHGYAPLAFHLSTLSWFLVLIASIFFLFAALLNRVEPSPANSWLALGVAAWFGLHPAMAETVNYVIQRGDLYCTLGCVAALLVYVRWPRLRWYGLYLLPFVLAMLSKPPAAVFPVLLLLLCFFFEQSREPLILRWRRSFVSSVPALTVTALLLSLQSAMTPKSYLPSILSPAAYRLTQGYVWLRYATALFLPLHLNVDTDLQPFSHLSMQAMAGLVFVFGLIAVIAYAGRRPRLYPIAFGLLWFLTTQLPTSLYALSEVENDHRMFFSFPGLMLAVVWSLHLGYEALIAGAARRRRWLRPLATSAACACLCGYAWGAHRRNAVWSSEDTLWADDVAKSPQNGRGLMIYGLTRMNAGDLPAALNLYTRALAYTPNYPTLEINLGIVNGLLAARGQSAASPGANMEAERHFQRALALATADDTTHAFYGRWLLTQGRLGEATAQLQAAVTLNPQRLMQRDLLLTAYTEAGQADAARSLAQSTLALAPTDTEALATLSAKANAASVTPQMVTAQRVAYFVNLSQSLHQQAHYGESLAAAQQAIRLDSHSAEAWNNVAANDEALFRWDEAIAAAQQAIALRPDFQLAKNNLAWAQTQKSKSRSSSTQGSR